ncbi:MAG: hypothetical protein R2864_07380 [Syntrophotaleaceae bacterium]
MEKPGWGEVFSDTINTGIYVLEPEVLDLIPEGENRDWSKDIFPQMLADQAPCSAATRPATGPTLAIPMPIWRPARTFCAARWLSISTKARRPDMNESSWAKRPSLAPANRPRWKAWSSSAATLRSKAERG